MDKLLAFATGNLRTMVFQLQPSSDHSYILDIVEVDDLACPINQCCLFFNKMPGPLSPESRLGSQITTMNLTDQDLTEFIKTE